MASAGRPCSIQASTARAAGAPNGTVRSLAALAEHSEHPSLEVDVVDVEPDELADPDPGPVEQLEHGPVAPAHRVVVARDGPRHVEQTRCLVLSQHLRDHAMRLRAAESSADVVLEESAPVRPAGERPGAGRAARDAGPSPPPAALASQPAPQEGEVDTVEMMHAEA